ncbi:MAG: glycosyltransferase family 2 protein [Armatimonadota bacterium]
MPLVSVVVLNWNGAHLLPACLDSVRTQTLHDFEIILADNGSTDGSLELVAERYPEVGIVPLGANLGFSRAVNAGIHSSRGEFVALLNNDTELDARCLEGLVCAMRGDGRVGMCATKMVYHDDPSIINSAGHECGSDGVVIDIGRGEPDGPRFSEPREVLGACAGAALYRRAMLDEIGLFDPDFFISFEDADLNWRAQWAGWRCRYVPSAVVKHREGVSREIRSRRAVYLGLRNTVHVWVKDWPVASLVRHLPGIWSGLWRSMASLAFRGRGRTVMTAMWGATSQMPRMLNRRRTIRRTRAVGIARFEELVGKKARAVQLHPFDSGLRLGLVRLGQAACAGALSLAMLALVVCATALVDAAERVGEAMGRNRERPSRRKTEEATSRQDSRSGG